MAAEAPVEVWRLLVRRFRGGKASARAPPHRNRLSKSKNVRSRHAAGSGRVCESGNALAGCEECPHCLRVKDHLFLD